MTPRIRRHGLAYYGIASACLALFSTATSSCKDAPTIDHFVFGKVVEEHMLESSTEPVKVTKKEGEKTERIEEYNRADKERAYVLRVEATEMIREGEATKMVPQMYTLTVRDSPTFPLWLLDQQIYPGTEIVFPIRDDQGNHTYPVNRAGLIEGKDIRVMNPYEDPGLIKEGLETNVELNNQVQRNLANQHRLEEAREFYNEARKKKE